MSRNQKLQLLRSPPMIPGDLPDLDVGRYLYQPALVFKQKNTEMFSEEGLSPCHVPARCVFSG